MTTSATFLCTNVVGRINWLIALLLSSLIACGGASDSSPPPPAEAEYPQKISNLIATDSLVIFTVEVADDRFELFSFNQLTGKRAGISDTVSADSISAKKGLRPVALSPDHSRIAFRADKNNDGRDELYSNLIDGSDEVLLTSALGTTPATNGGNLLHYNWEWTGDSSRIIFTSDQDNDGIYEIYSINADGNGLINLNSELAVSCYSENCWKFSPDGSLITFLVETQNPSAQISQSLYAVSPDGSGLVMLNHILADDSRIHDWQWAADSTKLVYLSQNIGSQKHLYSVLADGSNRVLLSNDSITTGVETFAWSPDASLIAYTHDARAGGIASLYVNQPDGSNPVHLIDTHNVATPMINEWQWSPDSSSIAYRADQETAGVSELFTATVDGEWHRKMNLPLIGNTSVSAQWQWSPDSLYIAFYAESESDKSDDELYVSSADGKSKNRVNIDISENGKLATTQPHWLNNSERLIYQIYSDSETETIEGTFSVLPDGSNNKRLTTSVDSEHKIIEEYLVSPDSSDLLYLVESSSGLNRSLYRVSLDASTRSSLELIGKVNQAAWLSDSSRVVYQVQSNSNESERLYSVLPDGSDKIRLY